MLSGPSEKAFSVADDIVTKKRNLLESNTVRLLMLSKAWLGFVHYRKDEYAEALLGEESHYEADGESAAGSDDGADSIMNEWVI